MNRRNIIKAAPFLALGTAIHQNLDAGRNQFIELKGVKDVRCDCFLVRIGQTPYKDGNEYCGIEVEITFLNGSRTKEKFFDCRVEDINGDKKRVIFDQADHDNSKNPYGGNSRRIDAIFDKNSKLEKVLIRDGYKPTEEEMHASYLRFLRRKDSKL